jgi:2-haloacid dehalogenase
MDQLDHDREATATRQRKPVLLILDVNETLSDMAPLAERFSQVGATGATAKTWFASLLRDGFALTVNGVNPEFASLARDQLRQTLASAQLTGSVDDAVEHIMSGFSELTCHPDVVEGIHALAGLGLRLVTLSNGSAHVARRLLTDAGIADRFESFLSVERAKVWKPGRAAYAYALEHCNVDAADAMLVAVHPWDTDGARRAGLAAAWVDRGVGPYPAYFLAPDLHVRSLVDLAEQLA